jgi:hypothetical protein
VGGAATSREIKGAPVKKKQANRKPIKPVYIVVLRQNLDDTICGAWSTRLQAWNQFDAVRKNPGEVLDKNNMGTSDKSGLIAVAIYQVRRDKVKQILQMDLDESASAAGH